MITSVYYIHTIWNIWRKFNLNCRRRFNKKIAPSIIADVYSKQYGENSTRNTNVQIDFYRKTSLKKTFCRYCDDLSVAGCLSVSLLRCLLVTPGAIWITRRRIVRFTSKVLPTYRWMSTTRNYKNDHYIMLSRHRNLTQKMTTRGKTQKMVIYGRLWPT